VYVFIL